MSTESVRLLWSVLGEASLRAAGAAALAALVLAVTRTRAPGVRHAVWASITVAMLAMPLLPHALPPVRVAALPAADLWPALSPEVVFVPATETLQAQPRAAAPSAPSPSAPVRITPASSSRRVSWAAAGAYLYLAGVFASLVYVGAGWLAMTAIVRRSRPVALPDGSLVHESAIVAAPLTAGVFAPRIILPVTWRAWPAETLRAVLTHERTHIIRRDPLIALAARINRCVFWFHPLAWWLERKLASVAEFACDETASRACRAPAEYAQVLVDIADDVRRNGGRLAWQGIAVSGNGQLKDRIERLLAGTPWPATSRGKKALIAAACVAAVAIAAACRPATQVQPLQPDAALAAKRTEQKARTARDYQAIQMTPEQVAALEAAVTRNPDDRESREKLLLYYGNFRQYMSEAPLRLDPAALAARRAHVLWMTEHHPDVDSQSSWWLRLYTTNEDPNPDPEGYAQARRLWLAHIARPDVSVQTLTNAARFFEVADKPLAEAAYLQAEAREPGKWSGELGRLYAFTIVGSDASMPHNVLRHVSMTAAHTPYADQIRRKLDESTDATLLESAGRYVLFAEKFQNRDKTGRPIDGRPIDFDVVALGKTYLERAVALDPGATSAAALLAIRQTQERSWQVFKSLKGVWRPTPEEVAALPETQRLDILWRLIGDAFFEGENRIYNNKDTAGGRAAWQRLSIYANDALTIGPRHPEHPEAGQAMFNAHIHLGTVALFDGDVRRALAHLEAAPGVVRPETKQYAGGVGTNRLVRYLLKAGEYDAVARYYDRMAPFNATEREFMTRSAEAIRAGRMPEWYQMVTEGETAR
jgi:beta-lactamase regulating signal transducer with metallopeptidase domain